MKTIVELHDREGKTLRVDAIENPPDVIFFGVRAFYSALPARGHYHEVSCARIADDPTLCEADLVIAAG
jgi:hypothetical protein